MSTDGLSLRLFDDGLEPLDVSNLIKTGQLTAEDLNIPLVACTAAEVRVYAAFLRAATKNPAPDFLANGYLVVDRGATGIKNHGRCKAHIANLIRKQLLIPLNPSASHNQYYLIGCRYEDFNYFASWIRTSIAWRFSRQSEQAAIQGSKRAVRPEHAETPSSLKSKGFSPSKPVALSLNSNPQECGEPGRPTRALRTGTDSTGQQKSSKALSYRQRLALAAEIAKLAQTEPIASGKDGKLLDWLNKIYGHEVALKIVHEAWQNRGALLSERFPMFTAQSVQFYARYRRKSHRTTQEARTTVTLQTLILECLKHEGAINYEQLRKSISLYAVQRTAMSEAVCREFEIDPSRLFAT